MHCWYTVACHSCSVCTVRWYAVPILKHSLCNMAVHVLRGRPRLRTNIVVVGWSIPSMKVSLRSGSALGAQMICPYNSNCCLNNCLSSGASWASFNTRALNTLEMHAEGMPTILRKQRQWKPLRRRRLTTTALYIRILRSLLKEAWFHNRASLLKSAHARPSLRFSSRLIDPSAYIAVPKYVITSLGGMTLPPM